MKNIFQKQNLAYVYSILILSVGFLPFFNAVDRVSFQWLYLGVINALFFLIIYQFRNEYDLCILRSPTIIFFGAFVLWGILSYLYAENKNEVIIISVRWINVFSSFLILIILFSLKKIELKYLIFILIFVTSIEVFLPFYEFYQISKVSNFDLTLSNYLRTFTGNKNITAAVILMKMPIIIYFIHISNNILLKFSGYLILFIGLFDIFILGARATFISLVLILISIILFTSIRLIKKSTLKNQFALLSFLVIGFLAFLIANSKIKENSNLSLSNRISSISIENTSTQKRLRYYKYAFEQFQRDPILGLGLGNWKTKVMDFDKQNMKDYVAAYHVHNDLLQIAAELGILGIVFILGVLLIPLYQLFELLKNSKTLDENKILFFTLFLSMIVYGVDINLNFPVARTIMQLHFFFLVSIIFTIYNNEKKSI